MTENANQNTQKTTTVEDLDQHKRQQQFEQGLTVLENLIAEIQADIAELKKKNTEILADLKALKEF